MQLTDNAYNLFKKQKYYDSYVCYKKNSKDIDSKLFISNLIILQKRMFHDNDIYSRYNEFVDIHKYSLNNAITICREFGPIFCIDYVNGINNNNEEKLAEGIKVYEKLKSISLEDSYIFLKELNKLFESLYIYKELVRLAICSSRYLELAKYLKKFAKLVDATKDDAGDSTAKIVDANKTMEEYQTIILNMIPEKRKKDVSGSGIVYFLHNSLPYTNGGYATRSHGFASAIKKTGYDIQLVTKPGYPIDLLNINENTIAIHEKIDDLLYNRLLNPRKKGKKFIDYLQLAVEQEQKFLSRCKPKIVIAASNYQTALPALIAARKLGIPFIYEVRGFWQLTRVSREPEFCMSKSYALQWFFEIVVCREADYVFTLTKAMRDEIVSRGILKDKVIIAPNACNTDIFAPCIKDNELKKFYDIDDDVPVIGYIGTFAQYEGLDDLATACGILRKRGRKFKLLLVGSENTSGGTNGLITSKIHAIAEKYNFINDLIMPGRIPFGDVQRYYSLVDIAPFPRKPLPVCEIVSPMKPLEALSMEKCVIVSDVSALTEIIVDGKTGLHFKKGNIKDLANRLDIVCNDKKLRNNFCINGRKWVLQNRTWDNIALKCKKIFDKFEL